MAYRATILESDPTMIARPATYRPRSTPVLDILRTQQGQILGMPSVGGRGFGSRIALQLLPASTMATILAAVPAARSLDVAAIQMVSRVRGAAGVRMRMRQAGAIDTPEDAPPDDIGSTYTQGAGASGQGEEPSFWDQMFPPDPEPLPPLQPSLQPTLDALDLAGMYAAAQAEPPPLPEPHPAQVQPPGGGGTSAPVVAPAPATNSLLPAMSPATMALGAGAIVLAGVAAIAMAKKKGKRRA